MNPADHPLAQAILAAWPGAIITTKRERDMIDPTEHEIEAIMASGEPAGEYLDSIGKTDLAELTEDQWYSFLECVITGYQDKLAALKMMAPSEGLTT